jgi:hypothetical protein
MKSQYTPFHTLTKSGWVRVSGGDVSGFCCWREKGWEVCEKEENAMNRFSKKTNENENKLI